MKKRPVYIHLGAHRTGSSSFQACMGENRALFDAAGVDLAYPGRDGAVMGKLRLKLPEPGQSPEDSDKRMEMGARQIARFASSDGRAFVMSEENVLGRMADFYDGSFYAAAAFRLRHLRVLLPGPVDTAMLVVRPYDEVFLSAHRKLAAARKRPPFDALRPALMASKRGWADVVEDIQEALAPRRLIVVAHQKGQKSNQLLARLTDGLDLEPVQPGGTDRVNASASDAALIEIQRRLHAGEKLDAQQLLDIQNTLGDAPADVPFAAFTKDEADALWERYENDLVTIAGRLNTRAELP